MMTDLEATQQPMEDAGPGMPASRRPVRVQRVSLHAEVGERLRDMIVEGDLKPGERLNDGALAETLGVSRTPVREAIKLLASEGLVLLLPNRGARVAVLSGREIAAVFEVISGLERLAAELAAERMSAAEFNRLDATHRRMAQHFASGNRHHYFQLNQDIHRMLVAFSGNEILKSTHETLIARARRSRYIALLSPERWKQAMEEHEALMEALRRRHSAAAGEIMARHTRRTGEIASSAILAQDAAAT